MPHIGRPPERQKLVRLICDAQTRLVEATEGVLVDDFEEIDGQLHTAMTKLIAARAANRELQRKKLGLPTIAETG